MGGRGQVMRRNPIETRRIGAKDHEPLGRQSLGPLGVEAQGRGALVVHQVGDLDLTREGMCESGCRVGQVGKKKSEETKGYDEEKSLTARWSNRILASKSSFLACSSWAATLSAFSDSLAWVAGEQSGEGRAECKQHIQTSK